MRELFEKLKHVDFMDAYKIPLIDTCFFIYAFEHNKTEGLIGRGMTSFNVEEFLHVHHHLHEKLGHSIRRFLNSSPDFRVIQLPLHPGNPNPEHSFVQSIDSGLLKHVADPSDAVLIACAIRTCSDIYTRDKHHLYTSDLENFLSKYNLKVFNKL